MTGFPPPKGWLIRGEATAGLSNLKHQTSLVLILPSFPFAGATSAIGNLNRKAARALVRPGGFSNLTF